MDRRGVVYAYEAHTFALLMDIQRHFCASCGSQAISKRTKYTPDFMFPNGTVVEAKGKFTAKDRKIAKAWVEQYAKIPYRMLFQRDNKLSPRSATRYSGWCRDNGIEYAIGTVVPEEWLK
jgi:hypothetical protein